MSISARIGEKTPACRSPARRRSNALRQSDRWGERLTQQSGQQKRSSRIKRERQSTSRPSTRLADLALAPFLKPPNSCYACRQTHSEFPTRYNVFRWHQPQSWPCLQPAAHSGGHSRPWGALPGRSDPSHEPRSADHFQYLRHARRGRSGGHRTPSGHHGRAAADRFAPQPARRLCLRRLARRRQDVRGRGRPCGQCPQHPRGTPRHFRSRCRRQQGGGCGQDLASSLARCERQDTGHRHRHDRPHRQWQLHRVGARHQHGAMVRLSPRARAQIGAVHADLHR